MTDEWPCWSCRFKEEAQVKGTYLCNRPISKDLAIWERWNLQNTMKAWRTLGTEKQLRGETQNDRPDCKVYEPIREGKAA